MTAPIPDFCLLAAAFSWLAVGLISPAEARTEEMDDPCESVLGWRVVTSEGVQLELRVEPGLRGNCLRLDYEFTTGAGFGIIQRDWLLTLPEDWEFSVFVRGEGPPNNLEFKLLDSTGDNVWWVNRRAFEWPQDWTRLGNRKRRFEFAWGPSGGTPLTAVSKVEFAIASSEGGRGTLWLDELTFRGIERPEKNCRLQASASSVAGESRLPLHALDGDPATAWVASSDDSEPRFTISCASGMELGGVVVEWEPGHAPRDALLEASDDGLTWTALAASRRVWADRSVFVTPDAQATHVRLRLGTAGMPPGVREVRFRPPEEGVSMNSALSALARESPRGVYPRAFLGEQTYWTIIGVDGGMLEHLVSEDGTIELAKRGASIEPFLVEEGQLRTWYDGQVRQELLQNSLPLPLVRRMHGNLQLEIAPIADGTPEEPLLIVEYRLTNTGKRRCAGSLAITVRPMQVNPLWQRLNFEGGWSPIRTIAPLEGRAGLVVNGTARIASSSPAAVAIGTTFDGGDIVARLASPHEALMTELRDPDGLASGALLLPFDLPPGDGQNLVIVCTPDGPAPQCIDEAWAAQRREAVARAWSQRLGRVHIEVPDDWLTQTFRSQLAYILINRDGPAIQPGSRTYERSWARDGSMTAAALLSCGLAEEARAWVDWYGEHLFESGKVPCVVDRRGPDPVPEHDSHGQYIWAVANVYRHTRDAEFLGRHWGRVCQVVSYIRSLRAQRMTSEYAPPDSPKHAFYGLVPESISHEGYSAKPMHSYWDDFFVLLGLKEAAYLASQAGDGPRAHEYGMLAEEFRACLYDSIRRTAQEKQIDFIPGCVELGDYDPTSTTVALYPCGEDRHAPSDLMGRTFERAWESFEARRRENTWDAYTPYEIRQVGAFVRLGHAERAIELLDWFHQHQRPRAWNHWAEVVWREDRAPRFIGDMPHTWVGSDFINALRTIFVYEDGDSLVAFAGVPHRWIASGERIEASGFVTPYGVFDGSMRRQEGRVAVRIGGTLRAPPGGIVIRKPPGASGSDVRVTETPVEVAFDLIDP